VKVLRLFVDTKAFFGEQGKVDTRTHDIVVAGDCFLARHRASGAVYRFPMAVTVAEVDMSDDEEEANAVSAAGEARRGRGRST
jgi:hypothetical protein